MLDGLLEWLGKWLDVAPEDRLPVGVAIVNLSESWGVEVEVGRLVVGQYARAHRLSVGQAADALMGLTYEEALREIGER